MKSIPLMFAVIIRKIYQPSNASGVTTLTEKTAGTGTSLKAAYLLVTLAVLTGLTSAGLAQEVPDTRGPIQNPGMTVKVDAEGMQAPGYHFIRVEPKEKWEGNWIGASTPGAPDSLGICLRKEFMLKNAPTKVTAWFYGDRFVLYVNGLPAARGPADKGVDYAGTQTGRTYLLLAHSHEDLATQRNEKALLGILSSVASPVREPSK